MQRVGNGEAFQLPANLSSFGGGGGQPLPGPVRQKMESFFGASFADVRVHMGSQAPSIGALAFTHGSNLYFAPGQYNPDTPQGQQLLGHELTHVVQQRAGRVRNPFGSGVAVVQDRSMEAEAERMGMRAAAHKVSIQAKMGQSTRQARARRSMSPLPASVRNINGNIVQRLVAITYNAGAPPVTSATATITYADIGTGTGPGVAAALIPSHAEALGVAHGAAHPYHHERGHLIGKQLGGSGTDVNNLVGLSDGTNAPLMSDIEGTFADGVRAAGAGASVWIEVLVTYAAADYAGPAAAPHVAGMVGKITYNVYDHAPPGNTLIMGPQNYPNGVVKDHHVAGCC